MASAAESSLGGALTTGVASTESAASAAASAAAAGASAAAAAADLAAAVRRLALASLLQDRLTEDSPTAEDGVKLLDMLPEVAAAAAKKAVRAVLLHGKAQPCLMGSEG